MIPDEGPEPPESAASAECVANEPVSAFASSKGTETTGRLVMTLITPPSALAPKTAELPPRTISIRSTDSKGINDKSGRPNAPFKGRPSINTST